MERRRATLTNNPGYEADQDVAMTINRAELEQLMIGNEESRPTRGQRESEITGAVNLLMTLAHHSGF